MYRDRVMRLDQEVFNSVVNGEKKCLIFRPSHAVIRKTPSSYQLDLSLVECGRIDCLAEYILFSSPRSLNLRLFCVQKGNFDRLLTLPFGSPFYLFNSNTVPLP
jgi:hypothetical protein